MFGEYTSGLAEGAWPQPIVMDKRTRAVRPVAYQQYITRNLHRVRQPLPRPGRGPVMERHTTRSTNLAGIGSPRMSGSNRLEG
jgi:hypothetical protein